MVSYSWHFLACFSFFITELIRVWKDVNLLAAPALDLPGIDHVLALVAGTGTVGRTIKVGMKERGLPLEDVAMSRGWGYL